MLAYAHKPIGVVVRTAKELTEVLARNPFPHAEPKHTNVIFLDAPPPPDVFDRITGHIDEAFSLGTREIYVNYPSGMGRSRLSLFSGEIWNGTQY